MGVFMAETNPLTEALGKITGALGTSVNVGQTSPYTPPDPIANMLAASKAAYAAPAATPAAAYTAPAVPAVQPAGVASALAAPAPTTGREFLASRGITPQAYRGMSRAQARPLMQEWRGMRAAGAAAPVAPATIPAEASPAAGLTAGTTPAATPAVGATPAGSALPWMGYSQYFAGNPEALNLGMYHTSATSAPQGAPSIGGQDPYRYGYEYNKYKEGLPLMYQDLINYGISPESVQSGQVTGLARGSGIDKVSANPEEMAALYGTKR
jgi:hypothetical protein